MMRRRLDALQTRFDALSLRERAIIFVAVAAMLIMLWDTFFMTPLDAEQRELVKQIQNIRTDITSVDEQTVVIMGEHSIDPNREEREQLANLDKQLQQSSMHIDEMIKGLIEPTEMAKIVENVLKQQHGLKFISLENLGTEALLDVQTEESGATAPGIFKHTMRIELEGSYAQTLDYLRALETLPWQFRWNEVKITMRKYPTANIVITVHTISLQEGWIGV